MNEDVFGDYADSLRNEWESSLKEQPVDQEVKESSNPYKPLYEKMNYKWKAEDASALSQIRSTAEFLIDDVFEGSLSILDDLFSEVRIPAVDANGVVLFDEHKRPLFEKDERGEFKENWDNLTGQDIEVALMRLSKANIIISQRVTELYLEANFAKYLQEDAWFEEYEKPVSGHSADRQAVANRKTRESRYLAFFRFYLWSRADSLQREIKQNMRLLEKVLDWRVRRSYAQKA